jgi:hypothetical protein
MVPEVGDGGVLENVVELVCWLHPAVKLMDWGNVLQTDF